MLKPKMKYDFSPNSHFLPKLFVKVRYFPRIVTTQDGSNIELPICVGKPRMYCAKGRTRELFRSGRVPSI